MEFCISIFFRKPVDEFQVSLKFDKNFLYAEKKVMNRHYYWWDVYVESNSKNTQLCLQSRKCVYYNTI